MAQYVNQPSYWTGARSWILLQLIHHLIAYNNVAKVLKLIHTGILARR